MPSVIPFSGNPLDRAANQRREDAWLAEQFESEAACYLPFHHANVLTRQGPPLALGWLDAAMRSHFSEDATVVLLGLRDGVPHFAVDLSALEDPAAALGLEGYAISDARQITLELPRADAGILAQARGTIDWHRRVRFCGTCGSPTVAGAGGAMRFCPQCRAEHYPNPHPVVIMVCWNGDRALLGSGRQWAQKRYSALAGFMDQGETIEEAVAREVKEEVGLDVDGVEYVTSQPWPFPSNLMIGCFAHVTGEDVVADEGELSGARWFTREELRGALDDPTSVEFGIPGEIAIAHHLLRAWVERH